MADLLELLGFLHDRNPQVRQIALTNLVGHSGQGSSNRDSLFVKGGTNSTTALRDLKLLCRDQLAIAHDAFRALVNLSDEDTVCETLSDADFLGFLVSYILYPPSILADLTAMLLSNLTLRSKPCLLIMEMRIDVIPDSSSEARFIPPKLRAGTAQMPSALPKGDVKQVSALPLLLDAFCQGASVKPDDGSRQRKGSLHFLGAVLANISTSTPGRLFFLTPRPVDILLDLNDPASAVMEHPLSKILPFTEHTDSMRRRGVASIIRNCAFRVESHPALFAPENEQVGTPRAPGIGVLPYILLPLAGPEEYELDDTEKLLPELQFLPASKVQEPDPQLRLAHVETLLLLCTTRKGREALRQAGVYEIIRTAHQTEKSDAVIEAIERLVNFLKRDEAPVVEESTEQTADLDEDDRIEVL